jgi:hypothetical protein
MFAPGPERYRQIVTGHSTTLATVATGPDRLIGSGSEKKRSPTVNTMPPPTDTINHSHIKRIENLDPPY